MKKNILLIVLLVVIVSCKNDDQLESDIEKIPIDVKIERFDELFGKANEQNLPTLKQNFPFMFSKKYTDSFWIARTKDTLQIKLLQEVSKVYPEINEQETEIKALFQHIKYYFPEFKEPRIITTTSFVDYRNRVIVTDTISLISLDCYLGSDHEFYQGIQKYIREDFNKKHMVVDLALEYAKNYIFQEPNKTLLDEMIYFGKQLYFLDKVIPFKTEAERIGYTQEQLDWALANESYVWRYFVERELLFSTDSKLPGRFINPAPFTKFYLEEIDSESPGRLGQYIGWQIVKAYMQNNEVSLKKMLMTSPEEIFNQSKFKPRK
ncbi:MAG: gliding motility lipoprotein GldB [Flavobacteriales bacterium]|nr:gliding motility lipoprotein GldB [Flavobacteriia bacterium]NCP05660.1 gliding motility lipoprotein GldB [Flavobacteriales bacterium]PIV93077.1 MAG: gliding motility lipoprotein GldB [Flavobacteriaceae bacterium CG17_big_fil_post_rev_8_21_14_2_50_33_15]PIY11882.1 MAG: gliding motility lipoprotein GldB [Flavobacteriaceae bacterium CG_4_10_14_3_um_filter_33_47]PJB18300.1 MAG: gliding motility lipoprotein GldB [Flavobacteriaceae bacterium CG_4_9_14_3_um_filter_33_16]